MSSTAHPTARRLGRSARAVAARAVAVLGATAGLSTLLVVAPMLAPAGAAVLPTPGTRAAVGTATRATAQPVPGTPSGLPSGIEDLAPYVGQISCDPHARTGTLALARLLTQTYSGTGYLVDRACGSDTIASEHVDGRAVDWTVSARIPGQKAQAEAFLGWLLATDAAGRPFAMARRLGVMYIVWNDHIWSSHDPMPGWQPYSTCATHPEPAADEVCHRSRLHVSLSWAGALQRTSFWSKSVAVADFGPCRPRDLNWAPVYRGRNATPCPTYATVTAPTGASSLAQTLVRFSGATVGPGDNGPVVTAVQQALGAPADGSYGPFTADAMAAFQARHALAPSGEMDAPTWRSLLVAVGARTSVEQVPAPTTPANSLTKYKKIVLKYGSRGEAVMALQRRLGVTVSGWFGPKTRTAVVTFQQKAKLKPTGIVDAATWTALGA